VLIITGGFPGEDSDLIDPEFPTFQIYRNGEALFINILTSLGNYR
jgi:hypothetical protein